MAQLNVDCDKAAKECMWGRTKPAGRARPLKGQRATLYLSDNQVTTKMAEQIQYAAQAPRMFEYIQERFEWTNAQCQSINWKTIGRAKDRLYRERSIRKSKMLYGWLYLLEQTKRNKEK